MKKLLLICITIVTAALIMSCSNVANEKTKNSEVAETPKVAETSADSGSILKKDADGNYIKPENLGTVVSLGKYKGLSATMTKTEVTEEEVEKELRDCHAADPEVEEDKRQDDPNDVWVEKYTGGEYKTIDGFKVFIKDKLTKEKEASNEAQVQNDLITQVLENSEINVTTEAIEYYYQTTMDEFRNAAEKAGMELDEYLDKAGYDPKAFKLQISYYVEESVKQTLMSKAIMEAENLSLEEADYQVLADAYGYDIDTMKKLYGEDSIDDYARSYKVVKFIYDHAQIAQN